MENLLFLGVPILKHIRVLNRFIKHPSRMNLSKKKSWKSLLHIATGKYSGFQKCDVYDGNF